MHKLEFLLRKYTNNFLLLDEITSNKKIDYLNFRNIVTVTDTNLVKVAAIKEVINFFNFKIVFTIFIIFFCIDKLGKALIEVGAIIILFNFFTSSFFLVK